MTCAYYLQVRLANTQHVIANDDSSSNFQQPFGVFKHQRRAKRIPNK